MKKNNSQGNVRRKINLSRIIIIQTLGQNYRVLLSQKRTFMLQINQHRHRISSKDKLTRDFKLISSFIRLKSRDKKWNREKFSLGNLLDAYFRTPPSSLRGSSKVIIIKFNNTPVSVHRAVMKLYDEFLFVGVGGVW